MTQSLTKRCPRCGEHKPRSEYRKNSGRYDGIDAYCLLCERKRDAERKRSRRSTDPKWRARDNERDRRRHREVQSDPTRRERRNKAVRERERERRGSDDQWRLDQNARNRAYYAATYGRGHRRRLPEIVERDGWGCAYCDMYSEDASDYHVDHIHPTSRADEYDGDINDLDNLVLSCPGCNVSKGDQLLSEWDGPGL